MASDIKVLVVDDSIVYRELLRKGLSDIDGIEVYKTHGLPPLNLLPNLPKKEAA